LFSEAEAQYFVELLEELGFVTHLRLTGTLDEHFDALFDPGRGIQIAPAGWFADYPAASNFIANQLTCDSFKPEDPLKNQNATAFCDPDIDEMIERAARLGSEDPASAGEAWAEVDRAITNQSPWVSLVNPIQVDLVSERLGNYQYHPFWHLLLAQVWVR
jgi:peptide/nickel transport system substrate-binding protein